MRKKIATKFGGINIFQFTLELNFVLFSKFLYTHVFLFIIALHNDDYKSTKEGSLDVSVWSRSTSLA